jgi:chromosome partitioning protein
MIICIGSQKGGCGKSTLSYNLAVAIRMEGKEVLLVDSDIIKTSSRWAQERQKTDPENEITCVQLYGDIRADLMRLAKKYEVIIIDVSGRDSIELRSALTVSDIFIVPIRPAQGDLDALDGLAEDVDKISFINPGLKAWVVLNFCPTNPQTTDAKDARNLLQKYSAFKVAETLMHDRKAFRDAQAEGLSVLEWKDEKAAESIRNLKKEIVNGDA